MVLEPQVLVRDTEGKLRTPHYMAEVDNYQLMVALAKKVFQSGLFPDSVNNEAQALVILLTGKELGIGPMASLRTIHVIDGKAGLAADLMVALVKKRGIGRFEYDRDQEKGYCKLTATRTDTGETYVAIWDRERVERSGINKGREGKIKHNWAAHEPTQLKHRCDSEACRALWPDVILNLYTHEELDEIKGVQILEAPEPSRTEAIKDTLGVKEAPEADQQLPPEQRNSGAEPPLVSADPQEPGKESPGQETALARTTAEREKAGGGQPTKKGKAAKAKAGKAEEKAPEPPAEVVIPANLPLALDRLYTIQGDVFEQAAREIGVDGMQIADMAEDQQRALYRLIHARLEGAPT